ncbi:MAG: DNA photolyase family protein [Hoeflea sp.]|uniref:cryptochrome/photolyase family protein n=1 Tax=Hoeflea sp. TaxID=1940281 RepID=UPI001DF91174|nr:deoxyribodipyrimidine photo-lyase [Hoeflea sp.]MBU4529725.1 DNA photolyase family protein [Alphaproteobacteria bacterium]MBU4543286.1 DNA photolyase family protein [Alphaproteobacteria bacterium]MBU4552473.1 DNA photolyase family protein [Alphaproteobacteria bacterium]MBV1723489.1 DNA photolyase family protein [Hoeflea sp.]MBV1762938.1 DNA photolyase family protein [Hoeflea sp.]
MARDTTFDTDAAIVWFRNDLRVSDNAALMAASAHSAVVPVFIRETNSPARPLGAARTWWLHHSLLRLGQKLESLGAPLLLLSGDPAQILPDLVKASGASAVYWNRRYDPSHKEADAALKAELQADGLRAESFAGQLLHEPLRLQTGGGTYYKVYSPFWRAMEPDIEKRPPLPAPQSLTPLSSARELASEELASWKLLPVNPDWSGGLSDAWTPGEDGAQARLTDFLENRMQGYAERRDIPGMDATSGLSPHLASGEITPAQIIDALGNADSDASSSDRSKFRKEVGWREFSWHLLANEPGLADRNHNSRFDAFPWINNEKTLHAWQKGLTGYPIVDAGMRELWRTGWMHNRVRMVAASFLTKHLMIDWRQGEAWFWDTLVDADPASNAASWQWVAGSGADAAPYFRIFNPILQGEKFDPDGDYVRKNVPELAEMPAKYIHKPWEAPDSVLEAAGVRLGETYPEPIVDHQAARQRALAAYQQIKDAA